MSVQKGKKLEKIIELIQESLKNSPETKVLTNYKIENRRGKKREIDVLVISNINGYEIKIAFECKNYKHKVSAEKIEAFNSKCQLIPNINKKIFVSSSGYQSGAIESAEDFDIETLSAPELTPETILNIIDSKILVIKLFPKFTPPTIEFETDKKELIDKVLNNFDGKIYFNTNEHLTIPELLLNILDENLANVRQNAIEQWAKLDEEKKKDEFPVKFGAKLINGWIKFQDQKIKVNNIISHTYAKFEEVKINIIDKKALINKAGDIQANAVSLQIDNEFSAHIITNNNSNTDFYLTDDKGNSTKLELLHSFKPKDPNSA